MQEDRIFSIANTYGESGHQKVVVICDRGAMDGEAYVGVDEYKSLLESLGYSARQLSDDRYHGVMHLVTTAIGAEDFYTLSNNSARSETLEEAKSLDLRTRNAWLRHQHPRLIDNSTGFDGKYYRLLKEICGILGDPAPLEKEEKFLVEEFDPKQITVPWTKSVIVQDYLYVLDDNGEERRVRARSDDEGTSYYYTAKKEIKPGVRVEKERIITKREYEDFLLLRDKKMKTIVKHRYCFFWNNIFFEVDVFDNQLKGLSVMEVEGEKIPSDLFPHFIKVVRNVTGNKAYSNSNLAHAGLPLL